jgi:hypothetical protein
MSAWGYPGTLTNPTVFEQEVRRACDPRATEALVDTFAPSAESAPRRGSGGGSGALPQLRFEPAAGVPAGDELFVGTIREDRSVGSLKADYTL